MLQMSFQRLFFNAGDRADEPKVFGRLLCLDINNVLVAHQSCHIALEVLDLPHDLLVQFVQFFADDAQSRFVGDTDAVMKFRLDARLFQAAADVRPPAVDEDGANPHVTQEDDVLKNIPADGLIFQNTAAVFDDKDLAPEGVNVGDRLNKDTGFFNYTLH